MQVDRQEIAEELKDLEYDINNEDLEPAKEKVRELRKRFDVTDVAESEGDRTIGMKIDIWSYEYEDSIHFVTSDHTSVIDAVSDIVSNHIPKLANPSAARNETAEASAARIRNNGANVVSRESYDQIDLDEEISIHTDVYYMRATVHYQGKEARNITNPTSEEIVEGTKSVVNRAGDDEAK